MPASGFLRRGGTTLRRLLNANPVVARYTKRTVGRIQKLRDRKLNAKERWHKRSSDEAAYWSYALATPDIRARFAARLDPTNVIDIPSLTRALDDMAQTNVRILDVGSGPLTNVTTYPGKTIEVVAIDPLANEYVRLLRHLQLDPPVAPIPCSGDELLERFPRESFDVAFALNSLDHSVDPEVVLSNMLAVTKRTGRVALSHLRNEGERNGYMGIHFWNMDCDDDGHLVVSNPAERRDLTAHISSAFESDCWTQDEWVHCVIRAASCDG